MTKAVGRIETRYTARKPFELNVPAVNAPTLLPPIYSDTNPLNTAIIAMNAWRGRSIAGYCRLERVVTDVLVRLAQQDGKATLPHLVGQRMAALEVALTKRGDAAAALAALASFRKHDYLRTFLTHGDAKITVDGQGR